jgi:hypothetical protein
VTMFAVWVSRCSVSPTRFHSALLDGTSRLRRGMYVRIRCLLHFLHGVLRSCEQVVWAQALRSRCFAGLRCAASVVPHAPAPPPTWPPPPRSRKRRGRSTEQARAARLRRNDALPSDVDGENLCPHTCVPLCLHTYVFWQGRPTCLPLSTCSASKHRARRRGPGAAFVQLGRLPAESWQIGRERVPHARGRERGFVAAFVPCRSMQAVLELVLPAVRTHVRT